jgi:hypothetical protein
LFDTNCYGSPHSTAFALSERREAHCSDQESNPECTTPKKKQKLNHRATGPIEHIKREVVAAPVNHARQETKPRQEKEYSAALALTEIVSCHQAEAEADV